MTKIMWQTTWHGITAFNLTHLRDRLLTERPKTARHIFFATTWIIFADDKYWLNTYYTYTGPVTDILDTLIIHDLFAREGCICTDHLHFNKHMRFPWFPPHFILFLIFSCLLLKKNHHTVLICAVDCKILLHYEKKCTTTFCIIKKNTIACQEDKWLFL